LQKNRAGGHKQDGHGMLRRRREGQIDAVEISSRTAQDSEDNLRSCNSSRSSGESDQHSVAPVLNVARKSAMGE